MTALLYVIVLTLLPILSSCADGPTVNTALGSVLGTIQTSRKKLDFYSFRGIPYAESPVQNLRFKPPVPIKPWKDTFNATLDGPACIQSYAEYTSEDCLRLNIYTHHIDSSKNRPVLVFIHGGNFEHSSSQSESLGPECIMDHDIVLVTFNYRLGILGFFSTGDEYAPGNYGMKDQVEALRWVQNNIQAFGGNPNKVTIAGFDAGAACVVFHILSPMSKGLFHGAIAMGASAANNWATTENPLYSAQKQAAFLNCSIENSQKIVDCYKDLSVENIVWASSHLRQALDKEWGTSLPVLTPVIESGDDEKFLTKHPLELLKEGNFADVPLMIGTTRNELAHMARQLLIIKDKALNMSTHWNDAAPQEFAFKPSTDISKKIREFYLGSSETPLSSDSSHGLEQLYADSLTIFGVIRTAKLVSDKNINPVYLYQFNYNSKRKLYLNNMRHNLISQNDDLHLIFKRKFGPPSLEESKQDGQFADKLFSLWENFMETGNPTPEVSNVLDNVKWSPFKTTDPSYLSLNEPLKSVKGIYYEDRIAFWEKLFPL